MGKRDDERKPKRGGLTHLGSAPLDDPRYGSGWNFIGGKNINPRSEPTSEDSKARTETVIVGGVARKRPRRDK